MCDMYISVNKRDTVSQDDLNIAKVSVQLLGHTKSPQDIM